MGCGNSSPVTNNKARSGDDDEVVNLSQGYHDGVSDNKGSIVDVALNVDKLNPVQRRIIIALKAMKSKPEFNEVNFTKVLLKVSARTGRRVDNRIFSLS